MLPEITRHELVPRVGSLEAYMGAVASIPVLEPEEEKTLALRYREHADVEAARKLVLHNLRFVVKVAHSYKGYGLQLADLIQEGNVGLMKAVKRFDPKHGVRLISFAVHWIKSEICDFIVRNWRIVKMATTKAQRKLFFNLRGMRDKLGFLSDHEANDIAGKLNVASEDVREMDQRLHGLDKSFEKPENTGEKSGLAPMDYLSDGRFDPVVQVEQEDEHAIRVKALNMALKNLDERSAEIVKQRWLSGKKTTFNELAKKLGVSTERVRQIEVRALAKLKDHLLPLQATQA